MENNLNQFNPCDRCVACLGYTRDEKGENLLCKKCEYNYLSKLWQENNFQSKKAKLFIHQTDHHGQGYFGIVGKKDTFSSYSFEDDETGDIATAVKTLVNIGFINPDNILYMEGMEIYNHLKEEE